MTSKEYLDSLDKEDINFDPLANYDENFINLLLFGELDKKKTPTKRYVPNTNIAPNREVSLEELRELCLSVETDNEVDTKSLAYKLLTVFNSAPRYNISTLDDIPFRSGLYLFFEEGIKFGDLDRVVYVGDHKQSMAIRSRLLQHYKYSSKDGSVLLKYMGAALLSVNKDPALEVWMAKTRNANEAYATYGDAFDRDYLEKKTTEIKNYLAKHMTFTCIPYSVQNERSKLRDSIVETLQNAYFSYPAKNWIGRLSPYSKIVNYGLWQKGKERAKQLTYDDLHIIEHLRRY